MVIGTGLVAGMAYLIIVIARIIAQSDDPNATSRFTGTPMQALMVYAILGLVLVFGVVSVVAGAWQVRYGTRNPWLVKLVLGLAAIFVSLGVLIQALA
jgi:cytochrome b